MLGISPSHLVYTVLGKDLLNDDLPFVHGKGLPNPEVLDMKCIRYRALAFHLS